jgi:hypothetical protein
MHHRAKSGTARLGHPGQHVVRGLDVEDGNAAYFPAISSSSSGTPSALSRFSTPLGSKAYPR